MKNIYIVILGGTIIIMLSILLIVTSSNIKKYELKIKPSEIVEKLKIENHFISIHEVSNNLKNKKNDYDFIDVRNPAFIKSQPFPNCVNIPLATVLNKKFEEIWENPNKKILICNNSVKANETWMLLSEYGIKNIYVLQGGVNSYNNFINAEKGDSISLDNEKPLYDFSAIKNSSDSLTGGNANSNSKTSAIPVVKTKKKSKVQGGCS